MVLCRLVICSDAHGADAVVRMLYGVLSTKYKLQTAKVVLCVVVGSANDEKSRASKIR